MVVATLIAVFVLQSDRAPASAGARADEPRATTEPACSEAV